MEIIVRIGDEERTITPQQFIDSCERQGVRVKVNFWNRIVLCGPEIAVRQARALLTASRELEAAVMVGIPEFSEVLKERAAIMGADGLKDTLFEAALSMCGVYVPKDEPEKKEVAA